MADKEKLKCDFCGKSFNSSKHLEQHKQDVHSTLNKNIVKKPLKKSFMLSNKLKGLVGAGILVAIIGGIGVYSAIAPHAPFPLTVDGIQCNAFEQLLFHIHAHLDIIINGQNFLVPAQIGITDKCFYWLHTHDETGVIHIESPVSRDFTLGQFFDIWNKKFTNNQIFNYVTNGNNPLIVYVNGTKVPNGTNFRDIKLSPHEEIAIVYGSPPLSVPSKYNFAEGL